MAGEEKQAAVAPEPVRTSAQDIVDAWFVETFHNLALPTELQNRLAGAKEKLKARLSAEEE